MEVILCETADGAGRVVADAFEHLVRTKPGAVLGLATGASPLPTYRELIRRHRDDGLSFARAAAFLLDEYVGRGSHEAGSFAAAIRDALVDHVDLNAANLHVPNGTASDLAAACAAYENSIADAGGIDLQLLGIGRDGHIGFNEPTSSLASRTRVKTLTATTRSDNAGPDTGPHHAITMGIGTILDARRLVLVATGAAKAAAVARMVEGPVTARLPASALQLHPDAVVVLDAAAASDLELLDYYRDVQAHKLAAGQLDRFVR